MKERYWFIIATVALFVATSASVAQANGFEADMDPGECDVRYGGIEVIEEAPNANVIANPNWIIGECHVKRADVNNFGEPSRSAKHFWDFPCVLETDDTPEDVEAFASHAVLTPRGNLNIWCIAERPPE